MKVITALLALLLLAYGSLSLQVRQDDEVICSIPSYSFKFYSGYLPTPNKNIHYQFFPSQNDPKKDPILLWLPGDPGESALLTCYYENGPFVMKYGVGRFTINDFAWNKNASLLFIELPTGTGFTNQTGKPNQDVFVEDAVNAIQFFFKKYPALYYQELYLSGRGYGAVHTAYLAKQILLYNILGMGYINLKGILVGNPCGTDDECYPTGAGKYSSYHYEFLNNKGIFARQDWKRYERRCTKEQYDLYPCFIERKSLDAIFNATDLSIYNLNQKCPKEAQFRYLNSQCQDISGLDRFLNDNAVRSMWNIVQSNQWLPLATKIFDQYIGQNQNSYKFYPFLLQHGIKIWIYSGDADSYIPTSGTQKWVEDLAKQLVIPIVRNWSKWWVDDEVGGSVLELRDITLVTVKDGGFRTGIDKPKAMHKIVEAFLAGRSLR